jgi:Zn-dependent M28 family amino/carboxypeptidase
MALRGYAQLGYTIAGMIPGRSKSGEIVLFSAHYDHLGVRKRRRGDSIMNGANDNASGATALLMLAKYFAERNDNERTLLFCAFSGEEIGLKGSTDFLQYINPDKIVAGVNIEMIGVPQFGKKTVFITGEDYSLAGILKENLSKNQLTIIGEPDPEEKQLFQRSDNYPFVLKGIPAHSIMGSDDDDPCYHKVCDELKRIDVENMTVIIRAIAAATTTLINGPDAPARIKL